MTLNELQKLGMDIADGTELDKDGFINKLMNTHSFTQTHPELCKKMAEFGAGTGNITYCISEVFPSKWC